MGSASSAEGPVADGAFLGAKESANQLRHMCSVLVLDLEQRVVGVGPAEAVAVAERRLLHR